MAVQDFRTRVIALAAERKTSVAQLGYDAQDRAVRGTNPDTFKSVMAGRRKVTPVLIEAVARVLDVEPTTFVEYRLAVARQLLDEGKKGENLEAAAAFLERIEEALDGPLDETRSAMAVLEAETSAAAERHDRRSGRSATGKPAPRRATP